MTSRNRWNCFSIVATQTENAINIMGLNASIEATCIVHNSHQRGAGACFRILSGEIIKMSEETKKQSAKIGKVVGCLSGSFDIIAKAKKRWNLPLFLSDSSIT